MVNFAIIGCGRIFPRHLNSILQSSGAVLKAICDIDSAKASSLSFPYPVKLYKNYHEMINQGDIDVVNICTPSGLHAEMAMASLRQGKHVIVEKPMALRVSDAEEMIKVSHQVNKKLCIVLQNRYNKPMRELKKHIENNSLGKLLYSNVTVRWFRPQDYYNDGWHGTRLMDGGVLMNQAIHHIDALQWLMGMPEKVYCYKDTLAHKMEMEDTAVAVLRFSGKALASIEASTVCWPENLEGSIAVFGEKGSVKIGGTHLDELVLCRIQGDENLTLLEEKNTTPESSSVYGESHRYVIEDMISAIKNDREPSTGGEEGIKSLKIVDSLYRSADTNIEVLM